MSVHRDLDSPPSFSGAYDVSDVLPVEELETLPAGTNVLLSGPSLTERDDLALDALARGTRDGQHGIVVTATERADRLLESRDDLAAAAERGRLHAVDCSGVADSSRDTPQVKYVSSPGDLTGVGIGIVKCTQDIAQATADGVRTSVVSLSTLLEYAGERRTFNFVHVLGARLRALGQLGVWTLDPGAHSEQTVNLVRSPFDVVVELREDDRGVTECRVVGASGVPKTWRPL